MSGPASEFDAYRSELEAAERRVAGEIEPGARGLVLAILVFVLAVTFILPHTGSVRGVDVLVADDNAISAGIAVPSRIFTWLSLIFGIGFSMLALTTRRWTLAWIALAGSAVACAIGMLAVWSRQTAAEGLPGPGIGLILGWLTVILLTFHWARVVCGLEPPCRWPPKPSVARGPPIIRHDRCWRVSTATATPIRRWTRIAGVNGSR